MFDDYVNSIRSLFTNVFYKNDNRRHLGTKHEEAMFSIKLVYGIDKR